MRTPDTIPELRDKERHGFRPFTRDLNDAELDQLLRIILTPVPPTRSPNVLLWCVAACIVWAGAYVLVFRPAW